ncbi:MAG TPA: hypothetical protein VLL48_11695, partial [Longimicrobiales bacterium]|nr:hypothetical protein [Longimicrobiales bacterium]
MTDDTRREFLRRMAAVTAIGSLASPRRGLALGRPTSAPWVPVPSRGPVRRVADPHVGIQISPHTMLAEGIERCLDLLQETAAVTAVYPYSHAFHTSSLGKRPEDLASHFGEPKRDFRGRVPAVWVRHHDDQFRNTRLQVRPADPELEFADRDLFAELVGPARERGMQVYARVLEARGHAIEYFDEVRTVDVYGDPGEYACWNHPDYVNFWKSVVGDMFVHYDLDGFQWGAERMGPLMDVILPWDDDPPACFCEYCLDRGDRAGIDVDRARDGYTRLFEYVRGLVAGEPSPPEGVFTIFLRHLIRYPEILSWEYQYRLSRENVQREMYETIKSVDPEAQVGWHVDHQPSSWDLVYRAEMSYAEMAPYSDFIKLILYHEALGPRIRSWYLDRFQGTILRELSLEESLGLYYDLFGYDAGVEPGVEEL